MNTLEVDLKEAESAVRNGVFKVKHKGELPVIYPSNNFISEVHNFNSPSVPKIKLKIGESVQLVHGGEKLWYCPKCGEIDSCSEQYEKEYGECGVCKSCDDNALNWLKPLVVVPTKIEEKGKHWRVMV